MGKPDPSRQRRAGSLVGGIITALALTILFAPAAFAFSLTNSDAARIGRKVWQNECNGTVAGLTSWNEGENFASLGIGHFIWYPEGAHGPFDESFPKFVRFALGRSADLPEFLRRNPDGACPWNSRAEFERARSVPPMLELRKFLAATVNLQAEFLVDRLRAALPKMLAEARAAERAPIELRFTQLAESASGCYALVDYVNFKGEGTLPTERYRGEGWGLLQVLATMHDAAAGSATEEFARSARAVLKRRVENSPPERKEARWLPGWLNRINTYTR